ncbi:MAG: UDP-N-acetyl-D-mannosaminuronic acid transferase [Ignavibacteria bacterium]|nr:UDP-N-acetyl-D-mannosaminuronic acid transferase [Ignavibacteria bacterium]
MNSITGQPSLEKIKIFGIEVANINYSDFLQIFDNSINNMRKMHIAYANAHTLNQIYGNEKMKKLYSSFDLIHPDGIGIFLASKIMFGSRGLKQRITGSDFYEHLINESVKKSWSYFFFGHDELTLSQISIKHPKLMIKGFNEGYNFNSEEVLDKINKSNADILIIGLSAPKQEIWINENSKKLKSSVVLAVGEGIKVFAGKKIRGPLLARKAGFEWFFRFMSNPSKNFNKYIIGNNLFLYRVIREKLNFKK